MAQLVNNTEVTISSGDNTYPLYNSDGKIYNVNHLNIDGVTYSLNGNKIRELEMRIAVLENHIKAKEVLKDKYIIVLGE